MSYIIEGRNIHKYYQENLVVNGIDLLVEEGEIFGLLGQNGAGKTTTLECMLGIKKADQGEFLILGMNPRTERKKLFNKVGVQFQESSYQDKIKVSELCEVTSSFYKDVCDYEELLSKFKLKGKINSLVSTLSGGERQRLFIVLSLLLNPKVVFLDELTTGLDTKARRDVWKILKDLKEKGLTILLVSHYMDEVEELCDHILIMKNGISVFVGTVKEAIKNSPYDNLENAYLWYIGEDI